jgi:stage III sporulation protein AD
METLLKIALLCLAASVLASLLRRDTPELGLLLAVSAAAVGGRLLLGEAEEALALGRELAALTGLEAALFLPLAKVVAVSLVSRVGSALCADAGQSALARILESAGAFCALSCAVPLLRAAAELLEAWL